MDYVTFEQDTTSTYTAVLKDALGVVIGVSAIASFVVSLIEKGTGDTINSRTDVDLRVGGAWTAVSGMQAVIDSSGNMSLHLDVLDNAIVSNSEKGEVHIIKVVMTASGSDARTLQRTREYPYFVKKVA